MRVLGIDPGMATTGWGVVEKLSSQDFRAVRYGCFLTTPDDDLIYRLRNLARGLKNLIRTEKPAVAAVEELYFAKNSRTAASVGHARGVILYILNDMGVATFEYNPRQIKMALTGYGAADKSQMQKMVQRLLRLNDIPRPDDAADALAIALCHINSSGLERRSRTPARWTAGDVEALLSRRKKAGPSPLDGGGRKPALRKIQ